MRLLSLYFPYITNVEMETQRDWDLSRVASVQEAGQVYMTIKPMFFPHLETLPLGCWQVTLYRNKFFAQCACPHQRVGFFYVSGKILFRVASLEALFPKAPGLVKGNKLKYRADSLGVFTSWTARWFNLIQWQIYHTHLQAHFPDASDTLCLGSRTHLLPNFPTSSPQILWTGLWDRPTGLQKVRCRRDPGSLIWSYQPTDEKAEAKGGATETVSWHPLIFPINLSLRSRARCSCLRV